MKRPPAPARPRLIRLAALALGLACLTGCTSDGDLSYGSIYEGFTGERPAPSPTNAVRLMFDRENPDNRRFGVISIANASYGGDEDYLAAYRVLASDPDPGVRAAVAAALGMHGTVGDVVLLINLLRDDDELVRWRAADALRKIHNPDAVPALVERLDPAIEEDPDTRAAAAMALGQYPDRVVLARLIAAMEQPDYQVAEAAHRSLTIITGEDQGSDPTDWADWSAVTPDPFANQRAYSYAPYDAERDWVDIFLSLWTSEDRPTGPQTPRGMN